MQRKEGQDGEERMAMKVFALGKERMSNKGREGQRVKDGDESLCFRKGKKGKDGEERKGRTARKGQRGKEGEEKKVRKGRKKERTSRRGRK